MAKLSQAINPSEIEERNSVLPPGTYKIMATASEMKATSNGKGKMLVIEFDVQDGDQTGRKIYERLNIENENQKTVDIAFKVLGEIGRACGIAQLSDSDQVHGKMLLAEVTVDPAKPYTDKATGQEKPGFEQNRVKKYLPFTGTAPKAAANQAQADTATATASVPANKKEPAKGEQPPWKKGKGAKN